METIMPIPAQNTEMTAEQMTTLRKLLKILIADNAGKIINAEINKEPTKFIANTMTNAVITAISKLYLSA